MNWFNALIRKNHFCGVVAESHDALENVLYVRFYATKEAKDSKFEFLYTAYRRKNGTNNACNADEFDCEDDMCIDKQWECDYKPNCKFKKDELNKECAV